MNGEETNQFTMKHPRVALALKTEGGVSSKVMIKYLEGTETREKAINERLILRKPKTRDCHIIPILNFISLGMADILVMEMIPGTLEDVNTWDFEMVHTLTLQLLEGVSFLHYNGIAHCDLKPQNILVNSNKVSLYIADFSLSHWVEGEDDSRDGYRGTHGWTAPEVGKGSYSLIRADFWACGKVIDFMCRQRKDSGELVKVRDISGRLMTEDPASRPSTLEMEMELKGQRDIATFWRLASPEKRRKVSRAFSGTLPYNLDRIPFVSR